jgi:hypothetical protein
MSNLEQDPPRLVQRASNAVAFLAVGVALLSCGVSCYAWKQALEAQQFATKALEAHELATEATGRIEAVEEQLRWASGDSAESAVRAVLSRQAFYDPYLNAGLKQLLASLRIARQEQVDGPHVVFLEALGPAGLYRNCYWFSVDSAGKWTWVANLEWEFESNRSWYKPEDSKARNQLMQSIRDWKESSQGYIPSK